MPDAADTRIMAGGLNNPSVFSRSAYGVGITQLITDFGRTSNLAASARLQSNAEQANAQATREQVLLEVDRSFFGVLQAQALQNVAQQTVQTRQLLLDRVSILAANKLKSELDVSFARVSLEDGKLLLQKSQNDLDSAMASLSAALGYPDQHQFALTDVAPTAEEANGDVAPLIDQGAAGPPRARKPPRHARFGGQAGALRPRCEAAFALRGDRRRRFAGPRRAPAERLRVPVAFSSACRIYAGGYYRAHEHEADMRAKAAAETLRAAEENVTRDVRVAWLNLTSARDRLRTTQQLARYSADAYQLADAQISTSGSSSIVELSQAQLQLTSAQIAEATARYDVLIQQSILNYQIGAAPAAN